jgi:D-alanyl-D-alanine carboxypeptidase (penicillin-binding protein 5/6)
MMCALVVLDLAAKDPAVLDEVVTFSKRADETPGSTADVRAGEKAPVRELLYGLLLPSGNDAATAFAEHFGPRLEPPAEAFPGTDPNEPIERFVAEMNRTAARLGLKASSFRNPHGLSVDGHRASAADLVRLARAAMTHEMFRKVISTRLYGCTVDGEGGYKRNTRWENTNQLLATTGYAGVKTGTTDAAGACLVSLGIDPTKAGAPSDSDRRLIIAVLGATSPDARYTDTRNLFRWAWGKLGKGAAVGGE